MTTGAPATRRNVLLNALSKLEIPGLEDALQPVTLEFRKRLQSANRSIDDVFFPETGLASVVATTDGAEKQAEVSVVGAEGFVGIPIALGTDRSPHEIFMQIEGEGHSVPASTFRSLLDDNPALLRVCLHFVHVFTIQAGHTALANARGNLEQRLARWLLMADDRVRGSELHLTHEILAIMLGVRRAGVTIALQHLERRALIATGRGTITILDRDGMLECAGHLYGVPEAEFERLFSVN